MAEKTNEIVEEVATEETAVEEAASEVVEQTTTEVATVKQGSFREVLYRIAKLIDVKSIMTLSFTGAFIYLVNVGKVDIEQFMSLFVMIVGFYFGVQYTKE